MIFDINVIKEMENISIDWEVFETYLTAYVIQEMKKKDSAIEKLNQVANRDPFVFTVLNLYRARRMNLIDALVSIAINLSNENTKLRDELVEAHSLKNITWCVPKIEVDYIEKRNNHD